MKFFGVVSCVLFVTCHVQSTPAFTRVNLETALAGKRIPGRTYDPSKVDWAAVISGCKASCRFEKRLCNFYIRAAAHDSLSIRDGFGGADGSLLLTDDELRRPENKHDHFAYTVSKNVLALAERFKASAADVLAVCGGVAVEVLGGMPVVRYPFLVGRNDLHSPNPKNTLAKADTNLTEFERFATDRKLTVEEMTALMGTHSLIDSKGCLNVDGKSYCNPRTENCDNISMFRWSNSYYSDVCNTNFTMHSPAKEVLVNVDPEFDMNTELCKYTSKHFKESAELDFIEAPETTDLIKMAVEVVGNTFRTFWDFTVNDAWLGQACKGLHPQHGQIQASMNKFKNSYTQWSEVYIRAYKKMLSIGATWSNFGGLPISGYECPSGYISSERKVRCSNCNVLGFIIKQNPNTDPAKLCPASCVCRTSFKETDVYSEWTIDTNA